MEAFDKRSAAIRGLDFVDLDREIKRTMRRSAKDVIQIGYMLKQMRDKKLWEVQYSCLDEYLTQELGIDYTAATRFINLNSKYSLGGNSMEISAMYENYSQGLLIEMLNMPQELAKNITPEMTVKQVREIKRLAKPKKDPAPKSNEVIIDGEYREVEEKRNCCDVATTEEPKDKTEKKAPAERVTTNDLPKLRRLLDEKKRELDECVKVDAVDPLPEGYIYERKTIVGALAGMLCDLEDVTEQPEQEAEQPELPPLKNSDQRKEWLAKYKDWGLWYHDEHIDVNYYKYDFSDGSRLVVTEYPQRHCYWKKAKEDQHYYHLLERGYKRYGDIVYDKQYLHSTDSETYLVDFLKRLQKGGQEA